MVDILISLFGGTWEERIWNWSLYARLGTASKILNKLLLSYQSDIIDYLHLSVSLSFV